MDLGTYAEPTRATVGSFLRRWLDGYVDVNLRASSAKRYRGVIEGHLIPNLGQVELGRLSAAHIQEYYARALKNGRIDRNGGLSAQTVHHHHRILSEALGFAVRWDHLPRNVANLVTAPKPRKYEPRILSFSEVKTLLEAVSGTWLYLIVHMAVHTGLRRSEILGLRWKDLNLEGGYLAVANTLHRINGLGFVFEEAKTDASSNPVVLVSSTVAELMAQRELQEGRGVSVARDSLVFTNVDGRSIRPDTVTESFKRVTRRMGVVDLPFKDLRATHGSLMLEAGANLKQVQVRLRHSNISTTGDRYLRLLPGSQEQIVGQFEKRLVS